MQKTIDAIEIKETLDQILNEVFYKDNQIVIERAGKAIAVVISPSEYEAYKKQRKKDMSIFDEIRKLNKGTDPEELEKDIQEAIQAVRSNY
ncbi:MAG: type II toxin-antitoxin system Phd/YefM family antitoxin [Candidatus Poribacteria bacterium]